MDKTCEGTSDPSKSAKSPIEGVEKAIVVIEASIEIVGEGGKSCASA